MHAVLYGLLASLFTALFALNLRAYLSIADNSVAKLTLYNNAAASCIIFPFLFLADEVHEFIYFHQISSSLFWLIMVAAGLLGAVMHYASVLQIEATSPLAHNVSGTLRAYVQLVCAQVVFQAATSSSSTTATSSRFSFMSNILVVAGAGLYWWSSRNIDSSQTISSSKRRSIRSN